MRRRILISSVSVCVWAVIGLTLAAHGAQSGTPAGHYVLQGLREVGSELLLSEDGRFQYMLAYSA